MKKMIFIFLTTIFINYAYSQSFSASQLLNMVNSKNKDFVIESSTSKGFEYESNKSEYNVSVVLYSLKGKYGQEEIGVMKSDELFGVIYQSTKVFYSALKEKLLTEDFVYVYSGGGNKYYENHKMRIGVNDNAGIISLFVAK